MAIPLRMTTAGVRLALPARRPSWQETFSPQVSTSPLVRSATAWCVPKRDSGSWRRWWSGGQSGRRPNADGQQDGGEGLHRRQSSRAHRYGRRRRVQCAAEIVDPADTSSMGVVVGDGGPSGGICDEGRRERIRTMSALRFRRARLHRRRRARYVCGGRQVHLVVRATSESMACSTCVAEA